MSGANVPRNLNEWKKNHCHPRHFWNRGQTYFGFLTTNNEICLAKVRLTQLKRRDILRFLGLPYSTETIKQIGQKYDGKRMILIQIGKLKDEKNQNWNTYRKNQEHPNIILAEWDKLLRLPVPITLNESDCTNKNKNKNKNNNNDNNQDCDLDLLNQRWIITDDMYKNGYNLCLNAVESAKRGDWQSFEQNILNNPNIVE